MRGVVLGFRVLQYTVGPSLAADVECSDRYFAGAQAIVRKDCGSSAIRIRRNRPAHGRRPVRGGGVLRGLVERLVSGPGLLDSCSCCFDVSFEVQM